MLDEGADDSFKVLDIQDEQPVEALAPNGSHKPLRDAVCLRCPKRNSYHLDAFSPKDVIKAGGELLVPITNQEPKRFPAVRQRPRELPGLLRDPRRGRRCRAACQMHTTTAEFDKEKDVQPLQPDRLDGEEVNGEHALTVGANELPPCHAPSRANRPQPSVTQPGSHGRWQDRHPKPFELAGDPLIAPPWVLAREANRQGLNIRPNRPSTTPAGVRLALRDQPAVPTPQRGGRDQERVPSDARKQSAGGGQEDSVHGRDRRLPPLPPKDGELVP